MPDNEKGKAAKAKALRADAVKTIAEHSERWDDFRTAGGQALDVYFEDSFGYLEGILDDTSTPKDWVKDGVALLIGYCGAGRKLYQATYDLLASKD